VNFEPRLDQWPLIIEGAKVTLFTAALGSLVAILTGVTLGVASQLGYRRFYALARGFVYLFRGIPLLVLLFLSFYALPAMGLALPGLVAAVLAFGLNAAGYLTEVVRAALESVDRGQRGHQPDHQPRQGHVAPVRDLDHGPHARDAADRLRPLHPIRGLHLPGHHLPRARRSAHTLLDGGSHGSGERDPLDVSPPGDGEERIPEMTKQLIATFDSTGTGMPGTEGMVSANCYRVGNLVVMTGQTAFTLDGKLVGVIPELLVEIDAWGWIED
jgi:His/Glu/Gln/Arg/opine family amino acid ABC transporter permease subunit